jgi:hypothetical protein
MRMGSSGNASSGLDEGTVWEWEYAIGSGSSGNGRMLNQTMDSESDLIMIGCGDERTILVRSVINCAWEWESAAFWPNGGLFCG